ncbi:hypothetical protein LBMAG42_05800 [Deltaproteobacteria bacterium]|nr:hypothetical protein LBMAG42_05800 [Deltaproteobacteria bacterium]
MRIVGLSSLLLFLAACPDSSNSNKETGGINSGDDACDISPAACDEDGDGFKPSEGDCDDADSSVNPGEVETCNGRDDNCDGTIDEGVGSTWYKDYDEDGFGDIGSSTTACEPPAGYVNNGDDCDDEQPRSFPGNPEVCDTIDNDCDGVVDNGVTTTYYADSDNDGYGDAGGPTDACEAPSGYVLDNTDCDDSTNKSYPGNLEVCDSADNDCDGLVDEGVTTTYYADVDSDGYGDVLAPDDACALPTGYSRNSDDCDDGDAAVNPAAIELCNGIDDDCDGGVDESDASDSLVWYEDTDADSYGNAAVSMPACYQPAGYVLDNTDCDDGRYETNPGATEYCNGYDDNCDGVIDEDTAADASAWYADSDSDAYGDAGVSDVECYQPTGYVADSTDCDDADATSFPGGIEVCDGADNDCNGLVDDAPTDGTTYYADDDADGFGDPADTVSECALPAGYAENNYDCNDTAPTEPMVADVYSGSASGSGSLTSPFDSIQDAIDAATECVVAYPGTYAESIDLSGKSLDVWGVEGSETTIINPSLSTCDYSNPTDCAAAVEIDSNGGATPNLHGFTISGGTGSVSATTTSETCADSSASHAGSDTCTVTTYSYCGGGVHVEGDDPTLSDLIVYDNQLPDIDQVATGDYTQTWLYSYGGGLCVVDGNVTADDVWVINNQADVGGGIYAAEAALVSLEHSLIGENDASDGGGVMVSDATLTTNNSIFACNTATTDGGGFFGEGASSFAGENLAFYGNESSTSGSARGADIWAPSTSTVNVINTIVENDIATALVYGDGSAILQYNNVYNDNAAGSTYGGSWSAGAGSISTGGNFIDARCDGNAYNDDWTLDATSTAIDAGSPAAVYDDVDGTNNDMGAYGGPGGSW